MLIPFTGALGICPVPQERQPYAIPTVDTLALSRYARQGLSRGSNDASTSIDADTSQIADR
jgi:hypothetical protein